MSSLIEKWLAYAKADLEAAMVLVGSAISHYSYQLAVLHCHQAIEKMLKTVLITKKEEPKKTHNLIYLMEKTGLQFSSEKKSYIEELSPHYQPSRYPDIPYNGPILRYDKKIAEHHLKNTKELFKWLEDQLPPRK